MAKELEQKIISAMKEQVCFSVRRPFLHQVLSCPRYRRRPSRKDMRWAGKLIKSSRNIAKYKDRRRVIDMFRRAFRKARNYRWSLDYHREHLIKEVFNGQADGFQQVEQLGDAEGKAFIFEILRQTRKEVIDHIISEFVENDANAYAKAALSDYVSPQEATAKALKRLFGGDEAEM
jgi:hypothetical protein